MSASKLTEAQRDLLAQAAEYRGKALSSRREVVKSLRARGLVTSRMAPGVAGAWIVTITSAGRAVLKGGVQ